MTNTNKEEVIVDVISFTAEIRTNAWGNKCHAEDPDDGSCRFLDYEPQLAKLGIFDCILFNAVVREGVRCKECLASQAAFS